MHGVFLTPRASIGTGVGRSKIKAFLDALVFDVIGISQIHISVEEQSNENAPLGVYIDCQVFGNLLANVCFEYTRLRGAFGVARSDG